MKLLSEESYFDDEKNQISLEEMEMTDFENQPSTCMFNIITEFYFCIDF